MQSNRPDPAQFDYQLNFTTTYDVNVVLNSTSPDKTNAQFQTLIEDKVINLFNLLNAHSGLKTVSTSVSYNNKNYLLTAKLS